MKIITNPQFVRPEDFADRLTISLSTLHKWEKEGKLPPKIRISARKTGWYADDVNNFILTIKNQAHGK